MRKETLLSPISGLVAIIHCPTDTQVTANELILQIECMKMYFDITAGLDGKVNLMVKQGEFVQENQELGEIIEDS